MDRPTEGIGMLAEGGKFYLHLFALQAGVEMTYDEAEGFLQKAGEVLQIAREKEKGAEAPLDGAVLPLPQVDDGPVRGDDGNLSDGQAETVVE